MLWISEGRLCWKWSAVWASTVPGTLVSSADSCTAGIPRAAVWDLDCKSSARKSEEISGCPVLWRQALVCEREFLFEGFNLAGSQAARTSVTLEHVNGDLKKKQKTANPLHRARWGQQTAASGNVNFWTPLSGWTFYCLIISCTENEEGPMCLFGKWLLQSLLIEHCIMWNWGHYYS